MPRASRAEKAERDEMICRMARDGARCDEIAAAAGVAISWVYVVLRDNGVAPTTQFRRTKPQTLRIVAALQRGERILDIAKDMGLARGRVQSVADAARAAGIVIPEASK